MPSPVGHVLGGLTAAFLINAFARRPALTVGLLAVAATLAVAPDLDILLGSHRTYTHSVGAVALVALAAWLILRARPAGAAGAAAVTAAYASHLALDWTSKDTSLPSGLTALWPFTSRYYKSGLDLFGEVSRRYWLLDEFIIGNVKAAMWECVLLAPCLFLAWVYWSGRTLKGVRGEGVRGKGRREQRNRALQKSQSGASRDAEEIAQLCDQMAARGFGARHIAGQLIRCGTSIGANAEEAQEGQTKADYIAKMSISSKESRESRGHDRID